MIFCLRMALSQSCVSISSEQDTKSSLCASLTFSEDWSLQYLLDSFKEVSKRKERNHKAWKRREGTHVARSHVVKWNINKRKQSSIIILVRLNLKIFYKKKRCIQFKNDNDEKVKSESWKSIVGETKNKVRQHDRSEIKERPNIESYIWEQKENKKKDMEGKKN